MPGTEASILELSIGKPEFPVSPGDLSPGGERRFARLWQERLSEVEAMIIDFVRSQPAEEKGAMAELKELLKRLFVRQQYDPFERAEIIDFVNSQSFGRQIEERLRFLKDEGRI